MNIAIYNSNIIQLHLSKQNIVLDIDPELGDQLGHPNLAGQARGWLVQIWGALSGLIGAPYQAREELCVVLNDRLETVRLSPEKQVLNLDQ